jgi:hypothetical protein
MAAMAAMDVMAELLPGLTTDGAGGELLPNGPGLMGDVVVVGGYAPVKAKPPLPELNATRLKYADCVTGPLGPVQVTVIVLAPAGTVISAPPLILTFKMSQLIVRAT